MATAEEKVLEIRAWVRRMGEGTVHVAYRLQGLVEEEGLWRELDQVKIIWRRGWRKKRVS